MLFQTETTVTRQVAKKRVVVRAFAGEQARHVLASAKFVRGSEIFGFTKGQFSFVDLIEGVLSFTGPADIVVSTWAASVADLGRLTLFYDDGMISRASFLLDGAFESCNKAAALGLREKFGDDNIRVMPNHAKFALISNDDWHVVIQTSMNLNQNKRMESFTIIDDAELFDVFSGLVSEIWKIQKPGSGFGAGGWRTSSNTLGKLGEGRTGQFFNVVPGSILLEKVG